MSCLVGTPAAIDDQRLALQQAMGLPVRCAVKRAGLDVTGSTRWDQLPTTYQGAGTAGWRDLATNVFVSEDGTQAAIDVPVAAESELGRTVRVGGRDIVLRARGALVAPAALPDSLKSVRTL